MSATVWFAMVAFLWTILAAWVAIDATSNSSGSSLLWAVAILMGGPFGVVIYYLVGRDRVGQRASRGTGGQRTRQRGRISHVCQNCGEEYDTDPDFEIDTCRRCGGINVERSG